MGLSGGVALASNHHGFMQFSPRWSVVLGVLSLKRAGGPGGLSLGFSPLHVPLSSCSSALTFLQEERQGELRVLALAAPSLVLCLSSGC